MNSNFKVNLKEKINLKKIPTSYDGKIDKSLKKKWMKKTKKNIEEILLLQQKLFAEGKQSLLIVLQAMDAGGKDSTIRRIFGKINPQGCRVTSFRAPTKKELSHDFLWRIHKETPAKGMMQIFNRSHYEDVLIVKVHDWIDIKTCQNRYNQINQFEDLLVDSNTTILKFYLHISKEEQKRRFQDRLDVPAKNWKFNSGDLKERELWDKYMKQFEDVFFHTSREKSPWFIIPANYKKYRDFLISSIVRETLEQMNPKFPKPEEGIENIVLK